MNEQTNTSATGQTAREWRGIQPQKTGDTANQPSPGWDKIPNPEYGKTFGPIKNRSGQDSGKQAPVPNPAYATATHADANDNLCNDPQCSHQTTGLRAMSPGEALSRIITSVCKSMNVPANHYFENWQEVPDFMKPVWDTAAQKFIEPHVHGATSWENIAMSHARSESQYHEWLEMVGVHLGPDAYLADDGSYMGEILVAKVPELVCGMSNDYMRAFGALNFLNTYISKNHPDHGMWEGDSVNHDMVVAKVVGLTQKLVNDKTKMETDVQEAMGRVRELIKIHDTVHGMMLPYFGGNEYDLEGMTRNAIKMAEELKKHLSSPVLVRLQKSDGMPLRVVLTPRSGPEASLDVSWPSGDIVASSIQAVLSEQKGEAVDFMQSSAIALAKTLADINKLFPWGQHEKVRNDKDVLALVSNLVGNHAALQSIHNTRVMALERIGYSIIGDDAILCEPDQIVDAVTRMKEEYEVLKQQNTVLAQKNMELSHELHMRSNTITGNQLPQK